MGVFEMIVILVFIVTVGELGKAFISRSSRNITSGSENRINALEAELRANEERLTHTEERVTDLTEKLRFVENLLAEPPSNRPLPPCGR
jgi:uncharacterized coiled-coil protein SlyX